MWVIWEMQSAPWRWIPSASSRSAGSLRSSHRAIDPYEAWVVGSTDAEPKVITSPAPPGRLADVVVDLGLGDQAVVAPARGVRGGHDTVSEHPATKLEG